MLKKIIVTVVLVGFTGVLIWGGVNRTLARSGESNTSSSHQGRNQGAEHEDNTVPVFEDHVQGRGAGVSSSELDSDQGQGNGNDNRPGQGWGGGQGGGNQSLDEDEVQALQMALDDEYHALAVYQSVLETFGAVQPFEEIAQAEQHHIEALLRHFSKHGILVPENTWLGNIPVFESVQAACQAGVVAESENIALYDQLLTLTDDPGLVQVFTNLRRASQESHLPELQACQ